MKTIKTFGSFIDVFQISEGLYDSIVGDIVSDAMELVKKSNNQEGIYNGVKIRYTERDEVPSFYELIERGSFLPVGEYSSKKSGIELIVNLVIVRDEAPVYPDGYIVSGDADDESAVIYLEISLDPSLEPHIYSSISPELRDVIRHEIEHLTQRGWNEKSGKYIRSNQTARERIEKDPDIRYRYYQLKDEIDANLHGLYSKSKTLKKPFKEVVMDFLDKQTRRGIIPEEKKMEIYNLWKRRVKSLGGLPSL